MFKNINITNVPEIDEFINDIVFNNLPEDFIEPIIEDMKRTYFVPVSKKSAEKTFSENINMFLEFIDYDTTEFWETANKEQVHELVLSDSDCYMFHFYLENGTYNFSDGETIFDFVVQHERQYDLSFTKVYFTRLLHLVLFKKELTKRPFSYLYRKEQKTMEQHEKKSVFEWKPLGPNNRQALYVGLQDLEKPTKFQMTCWKHMNGLDLKEPKNRFEKVQQEVVKDVIRHGYYVLEKENDTTDSAELDIKSSLDDYDNFNYTSTDVVVDLEARKRNYGFYGW